MILTMEDDVAGFGYPASSRFGTATLAPASLVLSQELANTIGLGHLPDYVDLLGQVETAQHWIDVVVPYWCASFGADDPHLLVTAAELPRLRAVRDSLRAVLGEHVLGEHVLGDHVLGNHDGPRIDAVITGTADITLTATGAHLEPVGSGAAWLAAAIAIEATAAHGQDTFRRLKLCHEPHCRTALYDRSKNNSRVWHDTATCGNKANARAHRARRRATAGDDPSH
jgi:predicted RNA-binding Zn ribbon-like protein